MRGGNGWEVAALHSRCRQPPKHFQFRRQRRANRLTLRQRCLNHVFDCPQRVGQLARPAARGIQNDDHVIARGMTDGPVDRRGSIGDPAGRHHVGDAIEHRVRAAQKVSFIVGIASQNRPVSPPGEPSSAIGQRFGVRGGVDHHHRPNPAGSQPSPITDQRSHGSQRCGDPACR